MADEAKRNCVHVDADKLGARLGMPVVLISAKYGTGQPEAMRIFLAQQLDAAKAQGPARHGALKDILSDDDRIERETAELMAAAVTIPVSCPRRCLTD